MIKMVDAFEVGRLLGRTVKDTAQYREDFVESEEVTDLLLASIKRIKVAGKLVITKNLISSSALVWNHPVQGDLNVFEWNATYDSSEELEVLEF
jgi:ribosomal protein L10